jgi:hypothetical protein
MSLVSRSLAVGAVTVLLAAAPVAASAAPTYPPAPTGEVSVSTTAPGVGDTIVASASGFMPDSDVDVTTKLDSAGATTGSAGTSGLRGAAALVVAAASGTCETGETCTVVADGSGEAAADVTLTEAGDTTITFAGTDPDGDPLTQTVTVDVAGDADGPANEEPEESPGGILPNTGAGGLLDAGIVAVSLLGIGSLLVLAVRRRRDSAFPV